MKVLTLWGSSNIELAQKMVEKFEKMNIGPELIQDIGYLTANVSIDRGMSGVKFFAFITLKK